MTAPEQEEFTISQFTKEVRDGSAGENCCIYVDLVFQILVEDVDFNPFVNLVDGEDYWKIGGFLSLDEVEAYENRELPISPDDFPTFMEEGVAMKKIIFVHKDYVLPLYSFLEKTEDGSVRFREYFKNDRIVQETLDAINKTKSLHELHRLLSILSFCWD
ncbi:hypothetical protein SCBWM1_gp21 [Synechococcus phage S-CBWM1]|uniref:Uncharacterized protein n=1 Tax=Synechococcus phage S-CBWM1 TaxID=2053653 RepID=A0A3G1L3E3_9CAUD|nr:hypothetical protein HOU61_gp176 [Synechococcus phage S-CBWM1]ATW62705.1 hypothetical protein SCBWM1_gp21 [Synechococcus phage S-CBWM1]